MATTIEERRPAGRSRQATGRGSPQAAPTKESRKKRVYWSFLTPALVFYTLVSVVPALAGVYASFTEWRGAGDAMNFTGLANYERLLRDTEFHTAFFNTLKVVVYCGVAIFVLAFALTMLIREMRGRKTLRSLLFFPYIVSAIVVGIALSMLLSPDGALNSALRGIGLDVLTTEWLNPSFLFKTVMVAIVWVTTGFYLLLLMAGVDRIPPYFYEDSKLAGANALQTFWHVTLPMTWDVVSVAAVLWVINSVRIFEFIYAFVGTASNPPIDARTLTVEQFLTTTGGTNPAYELGYGCAMGVVMVVLIGVLVVLTRRVMRRDAIEF
ncbi:carbohydrate ABC transporter permease [Streptomyces sp. NPDC091272]|uniref:carbohydrate ABC transporter permease n=1 Tax=Streptomyces sp. NPDC091272 TaxID=3365981 RepID=UPI003807531A